MGERKFKRAQNYHQDWFKFIDKLSLSEISKMADVDKVFVPIRTLSNGSNKEMLAIEHTCGRKPRYTLSGSHTSDQDEVLQHEN